MDTITVHGKVMTIEESRERTLELRNLNFKFGKSDGRMTELNAITDTRKEWSDAHAIVFLNKELDALERKFVVIKGITLHSRNSRGMVQLNYKSVANARKALKRLTTSTVALHSARVTATPVYLGALTHDGHYFEPFSRKGY